MKKLKNVMDFVSYTNYTKESYNKNDELDKILDKISQKSPLNKSEQDFLNNYNNIKDKQDYSMLDYNRISSEIEKLLDDKIKIICDIGDNHSEIESIYNDYKSDTHYLVLKDSKKVSLKDNFLYNLYFENDKYFLEVEDEYYEKLPVKQDED